MTRHRRLQAEPAYEDPVTGKLTDAHLWEELLGDDITPPEVLEASVQRLVRLGWSEADARAVFARPLTDREQP